MNPMMVPFTASEPRGSGIFGDAAMNEEFLRAWVSIHFPMFEDLESSI